MPSEQQKNKIADIIAAIPADCTLVGQSESKISTDVYVDIRVSTGRGMRIAVKKDGRTSRAPIMLMSDRPEDLPETGLIADGTVRA